MNIFIVLKVLSLITGVITLFMLLPLVLAFYDGGSDINAFLLSILCSAAAGLILWSVGRAGGAKSRQDYKLIGIREGVGVVVFSWIIASGVGALPYYFSGVTNLYVDAFFETMSGFTTTGATILTEIEAAPRGILLWRALTHWMGGMGIIVFSLAVMPFLGIGGMELFKAEVPGVTAEKLTPRLHDTAAVLWKIYFFLTFAETLFLIFGGMNLFDAFTHSCSTIATGGFSTKNNSIAYFNNAYIEWIITLFMFASGVNFSLYFLLIAGGRRVKFKNKLKNFLADEELRWYFKIVLLASLAITLALILNKNFSSWLDTFRHAAFHVVSVITTTGFITHDYNLWPELARFIFIVLMLCGACGGSTGGGCKVARILLLGRQIHTEAMRMIHPRAALNTQINKRPVQRSIIDSANSFLMLYFMILVTCTLLVTAFNHPKLDVLTSLTGVMTCLSNVGPGLNFLGPVENFAWLPSGVKWIFSLCMLAGRLELFAVILLFLKGTWRR